MLPPQIACPAASQSRRRAASPTLRPLLSRSYTSFLRASLPADMLRPAPRVFYAYAHAATGFTARLTERQAAHLVSQPFVLAVVPDEMLQLHTTLTPSLAAPSRSTRLSPAPPPPNLGAAPPQRSPCFAPPLNPTAAA